MKARLSNTLLARSFLRDRLPLQLRIFPGEVGYRPPLLQAVVAHSQLEGFDSDFALTRKLTAKFGKMTGRSRLGQEKSRSQYGLLFSRRARFSRRFTCRADSCLVRSLIGQRCSHGRHLGSLQYFICSARFVVKDRCPVLRPFAVRKIQPQAGRLGSAPFSVLPRGGGCTAPRFGQLPPCRS